MPTSSCGAEKVSYPECSPIINISQESANITQSSNRNNYRRSEYSFHPSFSNKSTCPIVPGVGLSIFGLMLVAVSRWARW